MILERDILHTSSLDQQSLFPMDLLQRILRRPLECRVRLRHKGRSAYRNLAAALACNLLKLPLHLPCQLRNGKHILICFAGKPDHKIQLHLFPSVFKGCAHRMEQVFFRNAFVDHIPHPLAAGFRRKSQPAFTNRLHLFRHIHAEGVDAQAGQGHADFPIFKVCNHFIQERPQTGIVSRAQRYKRNLLIAGIVHLLMGNLAKHLRPPLPYRTVHHARMAEPAAPAAAPEHLQHDPVVDDLPERHHRRRGKIHFI